MRNAVLARTLLPVALVAIVRATCGMATEEETSKSKVAAWVLKSLEERHKYVVEQELIEHDDHLIEMIRYQQPSLETIEVIVGEYERDLDAGRGNVAVRALARLTEYSGRARERIEAILRSEVAAEVKVIVFKAMDPPVPEIAGPLAVERLERDRDPAVRMAAASMIARRGGLFRKHADMLLKSLAKEEHDDVRTQLVLALGRMGEKRLVAYVGDILAKGTGRRTLDLAGIEALAFVGAADGVPILERCLAWENCCFDQDPFWGERHVDLHAAVLNALSVAGTKEAMEVVRREQERVELNGTAWDPKMPEELRRCLVCYFGRHRPYVKAPTFYESEPGVGGDWPGNYGIGDWAGLHVGDAIMSQGHGWERHYVRMKRDPMEPVDFKEADTAVVRGFVSDLRWECGSHEEHGVQGQTKKEILPMAFCLVLQKRHEVWGVTAHAIYRRWDLGSELLDATPMVRPEGR